MHLLAPSSHPLHPVSAGDLKDAFLAQVKASKVFFYNTVVAQAYRVDVTPSRITFTFLPNQRVPKQQCEEMRAFLEEIAQKVSGTRIPVTVAVAEARVRLRHLSHRRTVAPARTCRTWYSWPAGRTPSASDEESLRREAMADPSVQALFEIFPVEKSKIEEM